MTAAVKKTGLGLTNLRTSFSKIPKFSNCIISKKKRSRNNVMFQRDMANMAEILKGSQLSDQLHI